MSDEPAPRPMTNMLAAATDGQVAVQMTPEDFIYLDRDCDYFKNAIQDIQRVAEEISEQDYWGLGEANDELYSARAMVGRYKVKAKGAPDGNGVYEIMEQHYRIVEDIQNTFRIMRDQMMQADSDWAAEFTAKSETLPQRPPVGPVLGPYLLPNGGTR
ncbi:hypothetical protein [Nocardia sp. NBC_01329]|uniref:hypothetical protein n=1 Tax=Nocardia sp. NBC_01329 TaxID=2903594 RepID=UPI002E0D9207|nr:hypothetical protein OG405_25275 [Nocardia sp. NBC_01329]